MLTRLFAGFSSQLLVLALPEHKHLNGMREIPVLKWNFIFLFSFKQVSYAYTKKKKKKEKDSSVLVLRKYNVALGLWKENMLISNILLLEGIFQKSVWTMY